MFIGQPDIIEQKVTPYELVEQDSANLWVSKQPKGYDELRQN